MGLRKATTTLRGITACKLQQQQQDHDTQLRAPNIPSGIGDMETP
jgi:hypothetical protein